MRYGLSLLLVCLLCVCGTPLAAQMLDSMQQAELMLKMSTIDNLIVSKSGIERQIVEKEALYREAETPEQKARIAAELTDLRERFAKLKNDFNIVSTGIDAETFFEDDAATFDWEQELKDVFSPLVYELKDVTKRARTIEQLRNGMSYYQRKIQEIEVAIARLEMFRNHTEDSLTQVLLAERWTYWDQFLWEYKSEYDAMVLQLQALERTKKSPGEIADELFTVIFRRRGKHLFLAIVAFVLSMLAFRFLHKLLYRFIPSAEHGQKRFLLRLIDLFYYVFSLFTSVCTFLAVLYFSSDWLLLGVSLALLIGLIWAGKNMLPVFLKEAQLLLNFGTVREGERLMYHDVAWRVGALGLFVDLYNPDLENGHVRLPLRDLITLRSRPFETEEPWFPSNLGDWLIMADGCYGKVVTQTPEQVVIDTQRGSWKTYPMGEFLANRPQNLSRNNFSVNQTIRIAYQYRDRVNAEIAPQIKAFFAEAIKQEPYGHLLLQLIVELRRMNQSSLDLICVLKFKGDTASEYYEIGWKIQQIALDALNSLGLEIPYPHLQVLSDSGASEAVD